MQKNFLYICKPKTKNGVVAQVVEQWTENPCVAGSTPANTTQKKLSGIQRAFFVWCKFLYSWVERRWVARVSYLVPGRP